MPIPSFQVTEDGQNALNKERLAYHAFVSHEVFAPNLDLEKWWCSDVVKEDPLTYKVPRWLLKVSGSIDNVERSFSLSNLIPTPKSAMYEGGN
jgi:hypothetical protein